MDNIFILLVGIFTFIGAMVIVPGLSFGLAYLGGWIAKITIGTPLTAGMNIFFKGTFTKDMIPLLAGTLGWIGGYFKSINYTTKH